MSEARVALVTGSSRGIGAAIAAELGSTGVDVAINYRTNASAARAVARLVRGKGRRAEIYQADVADRADCEAMTRAVLADFGKIDILVNNAGTAPAQPLPVAQISTDAVEEMLRHHLFGPLYLVQLLVPQMRDLPRGDIIMISSEATHRYPPAGSAYSVAKASMEALAYTLAKEERASGIRVNIVAPGIVETDLTRSHFAKALPHEARSFENRPFGFVCQPVDIARAVAYLSAESGRYITGQRLAIDGGQF